MPWWSIWAGAVTVHTGSTGGNPRVDRTQKWDPGKVPGPSLAAPQIKTKIDPVWLGLAWVG